MTTDGLWQLSFVATRCLGAKECSQEEGLRHLISAAELFDAMPVTGLLVHNGNRLLYHMEGREADVLTHRDRIAADPRVGGIATLRQRIVEKRYFRSWVFALHHDPRESTGRTLAERLVPLLDGAPGEIVQTFLAFARLQPMRAKPVRRISGTSR
ncbi:MAG: BLUF domain-containing protein [Sphingobium sp.]